MTKSIKAQALRSTIRFAAIYYPCTVVAIFLLDTLLQLLPFWGGYRDLPTTLWHAIGLAVAIVIGVSFVRYFAFRNLYDPDYNQVSAVDRYAYVDVQVPYPQAFDSCLVALRHLKSATVLLEDRQNGRIEAAIRPANWRDDLRSRGQRVTFQLGSDQEGTTKILVTSRTPIAGSMEGKDINKRNLERIIAFLREEAEKQVPLAASLVQHS